MSDANLGSVPGRRKWHPSQTRATEGASAWNCPHPEPAPPIEQRTNAAEERYKPGCAATRKLQRFDMIRLILAGAAGWMLATRPEFRERVFGVARDIFQRLTAR